MTTITIIPGTFYIFSGTPTQNLNNTVDYDDIAVEIWSPKIEYDLINELQEQPINVSGGNVGQKSPFSRIVDLKRIKKAVSVQGFLADDSSENANTKRDNLISLLENKKGLVILWGPMLSNYRTQFGYSNTSKVFINKIKFTETSGIYGEAVSGDPQPLRKIDVQLQLVIGKG